MSVQYGSLRLGLKSLYSRVFAKADRERWSDLANFETSWNERAQLMASLIPPRSRVLEFGAGRRQLAAMLDASCVYLPSDLVSRGPDTFVCDLNVRPLPALSPLRPDVAVFGGVLEYLADIPSLARWLAQQVALCLVSYECATTAPGTMARLRETSARYRNGWVNTYTEAELEALFVKSGFICQKKRTWSTESGDERIFVLHNRQPTVEEPTECLVI